MAALLEAEHFLSPVLDRTQLLSTRNLSLLERLTLTLPTPPTPSTPAARAVLPHALHLLQSISATSTTTADLVSASSARTLNALMDLLVLEGIYPSLSPGVGVPLSRRARNFVLPPARSRRVVEVEDRRDVELLAEVVDGLVGVLAAAAAAATAQGPAARTLRERCLVDVLAGCGELAFVHGGGSEVWAGKWWGVVDRFAPPPIHPPIPNPREFWNGHV